MGKHWYTKSKKNKEALRQKNSQKRQQIEWIFESRYAHGTYMKVGVVHNKSEQNPHDVIAIQILNADDEVLCWEMRIDEAQALIFGLSKVLSFILLDIGNKGKFLKEYYESGDFDRHK
jgi:hypothetical protein